MNVNCKKLNRNQGTVLAVTLVLCAVLGTLVGSCLLMLQTQNLSVDRSQAWNNALATAEAGVEEAMAHLNNRMSTNNLATNSWADIGGGNYAKTNSLGASSWVVTIKTAPAVTNAYPVIVSTGYVPGPLSTPAPSRTVQVTTKPKAPNPFLAAMVVLTTVDFSGSGISTDSFDSSNTNYSTGGLYDPAKARDHGDVVSLSSMINSVEVANGLVRGMVRTGPGGTATIGNGSVGDAAYVNGGQTGFETGHFADDAVLTVNDVTLPSAPVWMQPVPGKYRIRGFVYKYVLDNSFAWQLPVLDNSVYVASTNVILYVTTSVKISSGQQIYIAPNCSLSMYVGAPIATIGGQGVVNATGLARDFTYYGLPSNNTLGFGANAAFVGSIYAPECDFTLGGGGSNTYDFVGRCITRSVKMNGHYNFHYDEALPMFQSPGGFAAASWDEL